MLLSDDVKEKIREFKDEIGRTKSLTMRYISISEKFEEELDHIDRLRALLGEGKRNECSLLEAQFLLESLSIAWKDANILELKMAGIARVIHEGDAKQRGMIDDTMIANAKEYPIEQILGVTRKGNVKCVWHDDTRPSMGIKNNHATCFSCGRHGDSIDVLMQIENLSFIEAVKQLQ